MTPDEINTKWYPGAEVRHTELGWVGTVTSNRVYATDSGAYVDFGSKGRGLVHWSRLELTGGEGHARPAVQTGSREDA